MSGLKLWSTRVHKHRNRPQIKTRSGWKDTHRHIMEKYIGRKLESSEIVHHCNNDIFDNKITNLELMLNGKHTRLHHIGSKRTLETRKSIKDSKFGKPGTPQKLTSGDVIEIRSSYSGGGTSYRMLAKKYNVTYGNIHQIIKKNIWRCV